MGNKLYFAHQTSMYKSPAELEILADIRAGFPGHEIINPSDKKHADEVVRLKAAGSDNVMADYFLPLVSDPAITCVVFTVLGNGKVGKGAYDETQAILDNGGRAFFYAPDTRRMIEVTSLDKFDGMDVPETRARLKVERLLDEEGRGIYQSRAHYARNLAKNGFQSPIKIARAPGAKKRPGLKI